MMRWRNKGSEHVFSTEEHASISAKVLAENIKKAIKLRKSPENAIETFLLEALRNAFEAGRRHGKEETADELRETIQDHVKKVLNNVSNFGGGRCPCCLGLGCVECADTGHFSRFARKGGL